MNTVKPNTVAAEIEKLYRSIIKKIISHTGNSNRFKIKITIVAFGFIAGDHFDL